MIILCCDGCKKQSPDAQGRRTADNWMAVRVSLYRSGEDRREGRDSARSLYCEECWPQVNAVLRVRAA